MTTILPHNNNITLCKTYSKWAEFDGDVVCEDNQARTIRVELGRKWQVDRRTIAFFDEPK